MPALPNTIKTVETFVIASTKRVAVERERALRIRAGAIRSTITEDAKNWILTTEWNVIGGG